VDVGAWVQSLSGSVSVKIALHKPSEEPVLVPLQDIQVPVQVFSQHTPMRVKGSRSVQLPLVQPEFP
jgi:hypothetical protein